MEPSFVSKKCKLGAKEIIMYYRQNELKKKHSIPVNVILNSRPCLILCGCGHSILVSLHAVVSKPVPVRDNRGWNLRGECPNLAHISSGFYSISTSFCLVHFLPRTTLLQAPSSPIRTSLIKLGLEHHDTLRRNLLLHM
jgi:hypothetical protein